MSIAWQLSSRVRSWDQCLTFGEYRMLPKALAGYLCVKGQTAGVLGFLVVGGAGRVSRILERCFHPNEPLATGERVPPRALP